MTSANGEKFKSSRMTMRNYKCRLESLLNLLPALPSPAKKKKKKGERLQVSINLTGKTIGLIVFFLSLLSFKLWPGKLQRWHPPYVNWFNFKLDTADVNQIKLIFFLFSCLVCFWELKGKTTAVSLFTIETRSWQLGSEIVPLFFGRNKSSFAIQNTTAAWLRAGKPYV